MKRFMTLLVASAFFVSGCATSINLSSSPPGIDVYVGKKRIGKTPLFLPQKRLGKIVAGGHYVQLRGPGYKPVHLWFPENTRGLEVQVNMLPFKLEEDSSKSDLFQGRLTMLAAKYLDAQTALLNGAADGEAKAEILVSEHPNYAASHFLKAVASLRSDDRASARKTLEDALKLNPSDPSYTALYKDLGGDESRLYGLIKKTNKAGKNESTQNAK